MLPLPIAGQVLPATMKGPRTRSAGPDSRKDPLCHCHNVIAALWADAVANRLEGMAIYLLAAETHRRADVIAALAGS